MIWKVSSFLSSLHYGLMILYCVFSARLCSLEKSIHEMLISAQSFLLSAATRNEKKKRFIARYLHVLMMALSLLPHLASKFPSISTFSYIFTKAPQIFSSSYSYSASVIVVVVVVFSLGKKEKKKEEEKPPFYLLMMKIYVRQRKNFSPPSLFYLFFIVITHMKASRGEEERTKLRLRRYVCSGSESACVC